MPGLRWSPRQGGGLAECRGPPGPQALLKLPARSALSTFTGDVAGKEAFSHRVHQDLQPDEWLGFHHLQ